MIKKSLFIVLLFCGICYTSHEQPRFNVGIFVAPGLTVCHPAFSSDYDKEMISHRYISSDYCLGISSHYFINRRFRLMAEVGYARQTFRINVNGPEDNDFEIIYKITTKGYELPVLLGYSINAPVNPRYKVYVFGGISINRYRYSRMKIFTINADSGFEPENYLAFNPVSIFFTQSPVAGIQLFTRLDKLGYFEYGLQVKYDLQKYNTLVVNNVDSKPMSFSPRLGAIRFKVIYYIFNKRKVFRKNNLMEHDMFL